MENQAQRKQNLMRIVLSILLGLLGCFFLLVLMDCLKSNESLPITAIAAVVAGVLFFAVYLLLKQFLDSKQGGVRHDRDLISAIEGGEGLSGAYDLEASGNIWLTGLPPGKDEDRKTAEDVEKMLEKFMEGHEPLMPGMDDAVWLERELESLAEEHSGTGRSPGDQGALERERKDSLVTGEFEGLENEDPVSNIEEFAERVREEVAGREDGKGPTGAYEVVGADVECGSPAARGEGGKAEVPAPGDNASEQRSLRDEFGEFARQYRNVLETLGTLSYKHEQLGSVIAYSKSLEEQCDALTRENEIIRRSIDEPQKGERGFQRDVEISGLDYENLGIKHEELAAEHKSLMKEHEYLGKENEDLKRGVGRAVQEKLKLLEAYRNLSQEFEQLKARSSHSRLPAMGPDYISKDAGIGQGLDPGETHAGPQSRLAARKSEYEALKSEHDNLTRAFEEFIRENRKVLEAYEIMKSFLSQLVEHADSCFTPEVSSRQVGKISKFLDQLPRATFPDISSPLKMN